MIEYQIITLEKLDQILQSRYADSMSSYSEARDKQGKLINTMRSWKSAGCELMVKNIFDGRLYYREQV